MWKETNNKLTKKFSFDDFDQAIEFINQVAQIARELNHHPTIINTYNTVELQLSTHDAGDTVTDKDRVLAKRVDAIQKNTSPEEKPVKPDITKAKLFTDGGSRGNPGPSALGYVILGENDSIIHEEGEYLGITTNNQAEYRALKTGLEKALELGIRELDVFADSMLVVNQVNGTWKMKNQELLPVYTAIKELVPKFDQITFTHVPRAMNKLADGMVNECLDSQ